MKEKVRELTITPNKDYVIWPANLENIVRDTILYVDPGCTCLYFVNGFLKNQCPPGKWVINTKEEEKSQSKLQLICVNTDMTFDICCGVGNIPFKDFELNVETTVGAHGECKIRIIQPYSLFTTLGRPQITAEEIDEYVKLKLCEIMTARLSEVLQHYDYTNVMTQQSAIAADLEKKFSQRLNDIGVEVCSFALAGIRFADSYQEQRKEYFEAQNKRKADKEERRQREREQRAEIDNIVAITNATNSINTAATPINPTPTYVIPPQQVLYDNTVNQPIKYCGKCGARISASAAFCPNCGKKLS